MQDIHTLSTYRVGAVTAVLLQLFSNPIIRAQEPAPVVAERGSHHRVWQQERVKVLPNGRAITNRSSIVELETGMHYQDERGEWLESREEIELFQNGAIARNGPHQVIFEPNINTRGAIDLVTPDGHRLRSHVLGIGLFDPATGNSELIAEVKDSIGELQPPNEIFYRDAFDDVRADLRYTYRKVGFVQDVIVRERIVLPAGFNPATTRLEVWTEFVEAPVPTKQIRSRGGVTDEFLDFGAMQIGPGKAFALDEQDTKTAAVTKRWMQIEGRTFLIEAVQFEAVRGELDQLPGVPRRAAISKPPTAIRVQANAMQRPFPRVKQAATRRTTDKIQMASVVPPTRGLVLDYDLTGSLTNYLFKGDSTYYISGTLTLRNPTFEGGAVVKYANTNSARINIPDPAAGATFSASAYRPVILTARDDHSVGDQIGAGTLAGLYASYGLWFGSGGTATVEHVRVSHAGVGLAFDGSSPVIRHSQLVTCREAIEARSCNPLLENVLVYNVSNVFSGELTTPYKLTGRHVTINQATNFASTNVYGTDAQFTNSLFVNVAITNLTLVTNAVVVTTSSSAFQTLGAAVHYLNTNSSYRNLGTTNIGSTLLREIGQRTTFPPVVIGNGGFYTNSLTLYPQAQRDTDLPDLGYHYDPLDYVFSGLLLTNATITAKTGVAIGVRTLGNAGLGLLNNSAFYCEGTADNLNRFVRYNTVQEQANTNWTDAAGAAYAIATAWTPAPTPPVVQLRFTEFSVPACFAMSHYHLYGFYTDTGSHSIRDCQFHGGDVWSESPTLNITNSLFNRARLWALEYDHTMNLTLKNSTFVGSEVEFYNGNTGTWIIKDNLFDGTFSDYTDGTFTHSHNAYTTNATRLLPNNANDVVLTVTNITYEPGALGLFYVPTNVAAYGPIFNAGSQNATNAGLYHYTMVTNQTRELSTTVDLGFHYVAAGGATPLDTDGDGVANYREDANGNGSVDSGETDWNNADSDGDGVNDYLELLLGRNPFIAGTTNDVSNQINLRLFTPVK